jgi:uncharacterized protein YwqG
MKGLPPLAEQRAVLEKMLRDNDLARVSKKILDACRPAIALIPEKTSAPPRSGSSHFGGQPDFAVGDGEWPEDAMFLCQINLADAAPHDVEKLLPRDGLLTFFVVEGDDDDGDYLGNRWIEHHPKGTKLAKKKAPKGIETFPARAMRFASVLTLPNNESKLYRKLKLTDDEDTRYHDDVFNAFPFRVKHRMLGNNDNDYHDASAMNDEILLALWSDSLTGFTFGDGNGLTFYVDRKDLKKKNLTEAPSVYIDA